MQEECRMKMVSHITPPLPLAFLQKYPHGFLVREKEATGWCGKQMRWGCFVFFKDVLQ